MSRYPANIITKSPATPTGPNPITGRAPGVWRMEDVAYWLKQGVWPDASADGYWPYVSLLLSSTSLSNANNNLFVDSSGAFNPVSRNGNTTQGSFTPYGSYWSNYFDGSGDYLAGPTNSAFDFGSGDFTVEAWICMTALPSLNASSERVGSVMAYTGGTVTANQGWEFYVNTTTNQLSFSSWGTANRAVCSFTITLGTWYHVAATRSGGTARLFINGVSQTLTTNSLQTNTDANANIRVGTSRGDTGYDHDFPGYISNARIVKGTAVYTADFTPSAAPLTAISGTSLLTCQSNRFIDNSSNAFAITVNGDTKVQKFSPFTLAAPGVSYNQSDITNWSGWFNGGTDRLQVPVTSNMYLGTTYTIEAWVYYNSTSYGARPIFNEMEPFQGGFAYLGLGMNTSGQFVFDYRPATSGAVTTITGPTVTPNTWHHIAVSNNATSAKMFVNGVQVGSTTTIGDYPSAKTNTVAVGGWGSGWNDGGIPAAAWIGYISNLRVVKGTAVYTANFTPPTSPLTAISGTVLLTCQNAAFTDNSSVNNILTPVTTATVTGNSPFNTTGYWSNYFDGSGDYLQAPNNSAFAFGTGDFTVEGWFYVSLASGTYGAFWDNRSSSTSAAGVGCWVDSADRIRVIMNNGTLIQTTGTITRNQWFHLAVVRSSGTVTVYYNGTAMSGGSTTGTTNITDTYFWIGRLQDGGFDYWGYSSNLRVVKGTAIYTSNFTVPTSPLTSVSGTSLLTCQNGRFIDNSTNAFTITVNGNTSVQPYNPFYTATIASNGGSTYFDGSGDYLSMPQSVGYLGAGDWTLECWAYATATPPNYASLLNKNWTFSLATGDFQWSIKHSDGYMSFAYYNGGITNVTTTIAPKINAWTHYAVTRSGTSLRIYANGVLNTTATLPSGFSFGTASSVPVYSGYNSRDNCYYTGYISGMRITEGSALYTSSTYTVPTAPQTPTAATTLLLNGMNAGAYDATAINDMETVGNAQVSTVQSKFGGSSVYFDGSGDDLFMPSNPSLNFGTGNWTIECWVYVSTRTTNYPLIFGNNRGSWTTDALALTASNSDSSPNYIDRFVFAWNNAGFSSPSYGNSQLLVANVTNSTGTWYHFAVVRDSSTSIKMFRNGTQVANATISSAATFNWGYNGSLVGGGNWDGANGYFNGYIDDLRVTNGVARYTANFTPPTQAFPVY